MPSSPLTLTKALDDAKAAYEALYMAERAKKPLWPAPYDSLTPEAAYRWLTECWWTFNEADGGAIELVPAKEFVLRYCHEWVTAFLERRPAIFEKSRRLVVSWMARGLECWVMGLSRGDWLIIDQTFDNAAGHLWRIHFSLEQLYERRPDMRLVPHQVRGAITTKRPTDVILANGSIITVSHQEASASQGKGMTGITLEELSKYMAPAEFFGQAILVTMGSASKKREDQHRAGGWVCAIANAAMNPEWHLVKHDGFDIEGRPLHVRAIEVLKNAAFRIMEGMAKRLLPDGTLYVVIHYTADDDKRGEWKVHESKGVPGGLTGRAWRREMELIEEGYEGKPVYETFVDEWHAPLQFEAARIPYIPGSILIFGWDCGNTMRPGGVLIQVTQAPLPVQVHVLMEVTSTGNEPMSSFAPRVYAALKERLPAAYPMVKHVGDATIKNRQGNIGKSAAQIAKEAIGVSIKPMSNSEQVRQSAVTTLLTGEVVGRDGKRKPLMIIDGACIMIVQGFKGAYRYEKQKTTDGSVRWKPHPEKNEFSEPHDALQYAAQLALKYLTGRREK